MKIMTRIFTFTLFAFVAACSSEKPAFMYEEPVEPYDPKDLPLVEPYNPYAPQYEIYQQTIQKESAPVEVYNIDVLLQKFRYDLIGSGAQVIAKNHQAHIIFPTSIVFGSNQDTLKADFKKTMKPFVDTLKVYRDSMIRVIGYTDNSFSVLKSQAISYAQAQAVVDYFVKEGIEENRLLAEGKGQEDPMGNNKTKEGRLQNNRVELIVVGLQ